MAYPNEAARIAMASIVYAELYPTATTLSRQQWIPTIPSSKSCGKEAITSNSSSMIINDPSYVATAIRK